MQPHWIRCEAPAPHCPVCVRSEPLLGLGAGGERRLLPRRPQLQARGGGPPPAHSPSPTLEGVGGRGPRARRLVLAVWDSVVASAAGAAGAVSVLGVRQVWFGLALGGFGWCTSQSPLPPLGLRNACPRVLLMRVRSAVGRQRCAFCNRLPQYPLRPVSPALFVSSVFRFPHGLFLPPPPPPHCWGHRGTGMATRGGKKVQGRNVQGKKVRGHFGHHFPPRF